MTGQAVGVLDVIADGPQSAAGQHGRELTRVPDRDHLRPHARRLLQQSRRRTRRCHPGLVQHNDAALRKAPAELLDVDERAVDRARRDPGILGQFASPRPVGASPTTRYPAASYNERSTPAVYVFPVPANASTTCTP